MSQTSSTLPVLNETMRKIALGKAEKVLRDCNEIRDRLALPPEAIWQVLDVYRACETEVAREKEQADLAARTKRAPMVIRSQDKAQPGTSCEVIGLPRWLTYRVEEIEICGTPAHWKVHSIKVGNVEQTLHSLRLPIPGESFRKGGIMSELRLDPCQIAMEFVLDVEYVGPHTEGEVFEAVLVGTAAR